MKVTKRALSVLLCLCLILSGSIISYAVDKKSSEIFRVSCTVNGDPATKRGFCWYTTKKINSKIRIYDNDNEVTDTLKIKYSKVSKWKDNYVHKATVSGLKPGTAYSYIISGKNLNSKTGYFKTDDKDSKLNLIIYADVQATNQETFDKSALALEKAFELLDEPDLVCNLGDFTDDCNNEQWDYFFNSFEKFNLTSTLAPVAGNHDGLFKWNWFNKMFNLDTSKSVQTINGVNYSFDYGNAHFTVLNTNDELSISIPQLKWLENDLKSTDKDWKIVLMHKSPYTLGKDGRLPDAQYLQVALPSILDKNNVDIVFSGHDHMYLRTKKLTSGKASDNGTSYVLSGTLGSKRYEIRSYLAGTYMNTDNIANLTIQKLGYANYWNGSDWDSYDLNNIGSCFNIVSIDAGKLNLKSYIYRDKFEESDLKEQSDLTPELIEKLNSEEVVSCIDDFSIQKNIGKNSSEKIHGNKLPVTAYILSFIPSFAKIAKFALFSWLPQFIKDTFNGIKYY